MGITERREREREEVRRKILDAAHELFRREGYENVTMRRIAEAIEYSPTTIYNHFEDKDDLVKALCQEDFAALLEIRRRHPQAKLVATTLGRDGVLGLEGDRFLYLPAYDVRARDTTGAGDVFHGAFVFALLQGWAMDRVLDFSNALAGLNCEAVGARGGIATRAQAERLMSQGRRLPPRWTSLPSPLGVQA